VLVDMTNPHHPTRGALRAALSLIAHSVKGQGKPDVWVDRVIEHWHTELDHISAEALTEAAKTWARTEDFRPSLSQFMGLAKMNRSEGETAGPKGCPDCHGGGWRTFAVHYQPIRGHQRCDVITAGCTCPKGRRFASSSDGFGIVEAVAQAKRTQGFIEVYVTDRESPVIPLANRVSPHQWQVTSQSPRRKTFSMDDV
jgi:hypothetical protein